MTPEIENKIKRFCDGDNDAFYDIHQAYKRQLWAYIYRRADSREDAEDIFNIVSMTVARKLPNLNDPSKLISWVIGIAFKCFSEFYRKKNPQTQSMDQSHLELTDPNATPETQLHHSQQLVFLRNCVRMLPEPQSTFFMLQFFAQLPQKEIARQFEVNINALKSHVFRSKLFIIKCLQRNGVTLPEAEMQAV